MSPLLTASATSKLAVKYAASSKSDGGMLKSIGQSASGIRKESPTAHIMRHSYNCGLGCRFRFVTVLDRCSMGVRQGTPSTAVRSLRRQWVCLHVIHPSSDVHREIAASVALWRR